MLRFTIACLLLSCAAIGQVNKVNYFDLKEVRLLSSPFSTAMEKDRQYLLAIDTDRLLAPYLKDAGLTPKADNYPNWENTGLDGHIGGHYLSALSLMYAATSDKQMLERVTYMVNEMERCQKANGNGYLSGIPNGKKIWTEIAKGNIRASSFGLNDRWVPLYNIHKTYSGLRDAYLYTGNEKAKQMLIKLTDWMANVVASLTDAQIQDMLRSEHGGLNEIFADVYTFTGNKTHLQLAKKFSHHELLDPLIAHEDKLTGIHANMQIPKVIGFKRIDNIDHNPIWADASEYFWKNVTQKRTVAIGGNSVSEHFNPVNDFSSMIKSVEGPETCNTYNMLKLTKELYYSDPKSFYMDYYERALYNHILSSQHSDKGGFVYFTPMRPGHYRVYSQPDKGFWCCVGSGMENHAKYGEMIYAYTNDALYVNLFIPSTLNWTDKRVSIKQENNFPEKAETKITINPKRKTVFTLKMRCPEWTEKNSVKILLNGNLLKTELDESGYISIHRKWKKGDVVVLQLPMHLTKEQMPDGSNYFAFKYGPVVLAAPFGTNNQDGLFANESRGGHIAHEPQIPLNTLPVLLGSQESVLSHVNPVSEKELVFHADGLYPNQYSKGLDLVPFYKIQGERYIIYWPQADTDKIQQIQQQQAKAEETERNLNSITIDKIQLGEQQPEADHFIEMDNAFTGYMEDRHYRDARGWFSYQMRNKDKTARYIYISYFDANNDRAMNVAVNGKNVIAKKLEGKSGTAVQYVLLPVPETDYNKELLTVKFTTQEKSLTPKIIEVRLLSKAYNAIE